jgi:hypothetical protein
MTDQIMRVKIEGPSKCEEIISSKGHHDLIVNAANDFTKRKRRLLQGTSAGVKRSAFTPQRKQKHSVGVKRLKIAGVEDVAVDMALERPQIHAAAEAGQPGQQISLDSWDLSDEDPFLMSTRHGVVGRGRRRARGRGRLCHNNGRGYGPVAAEDDLCRHLIKLMEEEEEELIDEPDAEEEMTDAAATSSKTQG